MAQIQYDSELMTNYVSAVPVPAGSQFVTVLDPATSRPIVFALSNDTPARLQATKEDQNGQRQIIDIGKLLKIPDATPIQTFEVKQLDDSSILLCLATRVDKDKSNLVICRPFQITMSPQISTLPVQTITEIQRIYLGPSTSPSAYPAMFVAHQPIDRIAKGSDISRVTVNLAAGTWNTSKDMSLPENSQGILDIAAANSIYGNGLYILYNIQGQAQLVAKFVRPDPDDPAQLRWYTAALKAPSGATCLDTISIGGRSALLVGCTQGIQYYAPKESTVKNAPGTPVTTSTVFQDIENIFVSQNGTRVCLWSVNARHELGYLCCTTDKISGTPIMLMPSGGTSSFSAATALNNPDGSASMRQILVSADDAGNLTTLELDMVTGIWRREPFYTVSASRNITVKSYTITIQALDSQNAPIVNGSLLIQSAASVPAVVNGKAAMLSAAGSWHRLDGNGEIALIVATLGITGQALTIQGIKDAKSAPVGFSSMLIDPTEKTFNSFKALKSADDLRRATTKNGKPLIDPAHMPSPADLQNAAKCFSRISDATTGLPRDGSKKVLAITTATSDSEGDLIMDGFHWIKEKIDQVTDWIVEQVGNVWRFVCTIAGQVKKFVLDCLEKVGEAFTWVLDKIKIGIDKIIEFAGFLFGWDDIIQTKNTISAFITAGIGYAGTQVTQGEETVKTFFESVKKQVVKRNAPVSKSIDTKNPSPGSPGAQAQNSTAFKWTGERMKNGGMGSGTSTNGTTKLDNTGQNDWRTIFQPVLDSLQNSASQVGQDISNIFSGSKSMTTGQLFEQLGNDFLEGAIDGVEQLTLALMKVLTSILRELASLGNKTINIPIFSDLYKFISGGHDLTIFDAISLLIAIPTTILTKAITGKAPPEFPPIDAKLLGRIITDDPTLSRAVKINFSTLSTGIMVSVVVVKSVVNLIRLIASAASDGSGGVIEFLTPSKTMALLSLSIDIIGTVHAMPTDSKVPGYELRKWISYLTLFRAGTNILVSVTSVGGKTAEKALLVSDVLVTLVNFGLYQAVYYAEGQATVQQWPEKDDPGTIMGISGNTLNTIAGVGWFTTMMFKLEQPEITVVGAIVFEAGTIGLAIMEGVMFSHAYERSLQARLPAPNF